jgi:hypothetical protein
LPEILFRWWSFPKAWRSCRPKSNSRFEN